MSPFLLNMLQSAGGLSGLEGSETGPDIEVMGNRPSGLMSTQSPIQEPVRPPLPPVDRLAPDISLTEELIPRKGMFGVKGTLRDILGTVGDAFLVQSGNKPIYSPHREEEKRGSAMYDFTRNPLQAAERLAAQGFTEEAQKIVEHHQNERLRRSQAESLASTRDSQNQARTDKQREAGLNRIARWVQGGMPYDKIVNAAKQYGIEENDLDDLGVHPEMTPQERAIFASGDLSTYQQRQLPMQEEKVDIARQNANASTSRAESARINASRPRPGPRPAQATEAAELARIRGIVNSGRKLSPGDQATWKKYTTPAGKKKPGGIGNGPPPELLKRLGLPAGGTFRPVN